MATGQPVIRDAGPQDAARLAEIFNSYLGSSHLDLVTKNSADFETVLEKLEPREKFVVLQSQEEILGWGRIQRYSDRAGYDRACEVSIYLDPGHLRKGLGTTLKLQLLEQARQLGYHHIVEKIFSANEASIQYNLKLGYEIVGVQKEIGFVDGRYVDITIMQRIL